MPDLFFQLRSAFCHYSEVFPFFFKMGGEARTTQLLSTLLISFTNGYWRLQNYIHLFSLKFTWTVPISINLQYVCQMFLALTSKDPSIFRKNHRPNRKYCLSNIQIVPGSIKNPEIVLQLPSFLYLGKLNLVLLEFLQINLLHSGMKKIYTFQVLGYFQMNEINFSHKQAVTYRNMLVFAIMNTPSKIRSTENTEAFYASA